MGESKFKSIDEEKHKQVREIERRINDLSEHAEMWQKAGGMGYQMAMKAREEVQDLKLQRDDILNGTNTYRIAQIEREIKRLQSIKEESKFFKKKRCDKKIAEYTDEANKLR